MDVELAAEMPVCWQNGKHTSHRPLGEVIAAVHAQMAAGRYSRLATNADYLAERAAYVGHFRHDLAQRAAREFLAALR